MSETTVLFIILALLVPLWYQLRRDPIQGIAYAVFLCVSMPTFLRIEMPGNLPQLTIFRLIVISLFVFWIRNHGRRGRLGQVPLFRFFCFWLLASFASLLLAQASFADSFKRYLDSVIEVCLFYVVIATTVRRREDALRILRAVCLGLTFVALLACIERYTRFNPVDYLPNYQREEVTLRDTLSTYQHRILLGTAMAMGWPLALALVIERHSRTRATPLGLWVAVGLLLASCYFAMSRGPWLGSILAAMIMAALGSAWFRKKLPVLACAALLVLLARPGVLETLGFYAEQTTDSNSFKGGTFRYRLELWKVAWTEISKSPTTFLFGYGPGAGAQADLEWELSYSGRREKIWSWDNHFAYDLFQSGVVGLAANVALFGAVVLRLARMRRAAQPPGKDILVCLLASVVVLVYMRTNVLIFAKQLDYLFWALVAIGFVLGPQYAREHSGAAAFDPETCAAQAELLPAGS